VPEQRTVLGEAAEKECRSCERVLPLSSFSKRVSSAGNRYSKAICYVCLHLLRKYHLTYQEYQKLLKKQHGRCALCGSKVSGDGRTSRLFIDHDHKTGEIRGLLCVTCNSGLGFFRENPDLLRKATEYLEVGSGKRKDRAV
jgi:hypothetical protein